MLIWRWGYQYDFFRFLYIWGYKHLWISTRHQRSIWLVKRK